MEGDLSLLFSTLPVATVQDRLRWSRRRSFQRCRRILERCLDLTPAEVGHRLSALLGLGASVTERFGARALSRDVALAALDSNFLFDARIRERACAGIRASAAVNERLARAATRIRTTGIDVFGRPIELDPHTIDWQCDPCTRRRLWADVRLNEDMAVQATRDADGRVLTDVKYVWELSRQQALTTLALAFRLGHDEQAAARIRDLIATWIVQNPPARGVNWSSVLEVAVRSISWLWTMSLVLESPALRGLTETWLGSLGDHYEFLRRHLSIYTDRSNHLIGEATALWLLAAVFPDLPDAAEERTRAADVLAVEIERQVTRDGVSREQAVGYQCFVLDFYLQVIAVARRQQRPLPAVVEQRVVAMLGFLHRLLGAGGALPQIGDGDDGMGLPYPLPLMPRERAEILLAIGGRLFERPEWQSPSALAHVLADLFVGDVAARAPRMSAGQPEASLLVPEGGYCFLDAATSDGERRQLIFDVGGLGFLPNAAHEHADALNILIRVNETLVLADPGTGTYTASRAVRDGFRSTASHNTVTIDGLDQADVLDTFKWINCFETRIIASDFSPQLDYVAAVHHGFDRLRERASHGREVLFVRPDYWIVADRVAAVGRHDVARHFHFPPGFVITRTGASTFEALAPDSPDGLRFDFPETDWAPTQASPEIGPWSPGYGRWETSARLVVRNRIDGSAVFLTLITPLHDGQAARKVACTESAASGAEDRMGRVVCRMDGSSPDRVEMIVRAKDGALSFVSRAAGVEITRTLGNAM